MGTVFAPPTHGPLSSLEEAPQTPQYDSPSLKPRPHSTVNLPLGVWPGLWVLLTPIPWVAGAVFRGLGRVCSPRSFLPPAVHTAPQVLLARPQVTCQARRVLFLT